MCSFKIVSFSPHVRGEETLFYTLTALEDGIFCFPVELLSLLISLSDS